MAITWIAPTEITPGTPDDWIDADVSGDVPAGATGVILHIVNTHASTDHVIGWRKNGSTDSRETASWDLNHYWVAIGVDGDRILELYVDDEDEIDVYLVAYFTAADATFNTNATDYSIDDDSWIDIDITADGGGNAIGAIFEYVGGIYNIGFRKNGSTDNRINLWGRHGCAIIGVDAGEVCEGYTSSVSGDFFLNGYILDDAGFYTNATDISTTTSGWKDLTTLPDNATGAFVEVISSVSGAGRTYGLRKNGSAENITGNLPYRHCWGMVESATQVIEGNIGNNNVDFFLVGGTGNITVAVDVTVSPATLTMTLAQPAVTPSGTAVVSPSAISMSLAQPETTVTPNTLVSPSALTMTLAQPATTVTGTAVVSPGVIAMTLAQPAPTIQVDMTVSVSTISMTLSLPEVTIEIPDFISLSALLESDELSALVEGRTFTISVEDDDIAESTDDIDLTAKVEDTDLTAQTEVD